MTATEPTATTIELTWRRFESMTAARAAFKTVPCVYAQADPEGRVVRVGLASKGLDRRYYGGTAYALDAAMHSSGNLVFAAATDHAATAEAVLIWEHRDSLPYNNVGRRVPPAILATIEHAGQAPVWGGTS
jgi:hypothetical protein